MATELAKSREPFFKPKKEYGPRFPNGMPVGKRTRERAKQNAKLRNLGIRHCELGISPYCAKTSGLTWAHSKKSRFLVTPADWQDAARCCCPCHQAVEEMSHSEMYRIIREAIKRRGNK